MKPTEYIGGLMAAIHSRLRSASLSAADAAVAVAALLVAASGCTACSSVVCTTCCATPCCSGAWFVLPPSVAWQLLLGSRSFLSCAPGRPL